MTAPFSTLFFWETANRWWVIVWSCWRKVEDHFSCFLGKCGTRVALFVFVWKMAPTCNQKNGVGADPTHHFLDSWKARRPYKWGENTQLNLCRILLTVGMLHWKQWGTDFRIWIKPCDDSGWIRMRPYQAFHLWLGSFMPEYFKLRFGHSDVGNLMWWSVMAQKHPAYVCIDRHTHTHTQGGPLRFIIPINAF